jgi:hypothetical protein
MATIERQQPNAEQPQTERARAPVVDTPATDAQEPDVLLDVSELKVARIDLEVDGLQAHVSLQAELANLLRLSVGVDARLDRVKLVIEGVEAKVLLKVRLRHVRAILMKALDTVAEHPEILEILSRTLSEVVSESLSEARATLSELLDRLQVGDTVDETIRTSLEEVRTALEDILGGRTVAAGGVAGAPPALVEEPPLDVLPAPAAPPAEEG